ncbi:MAG: hypothetical protein OXB91_07480 [Bryobacterales bacterium]|nr:hypothetical protein [Bryobacterales bacterium]
MNELQMLARSELDAKGIASDPGSVRGLLNKTWYRPGLDAITKVDPALRKTLAELAVSRSPREMRILLDAACDKCGAPKHRDGAIVRAAGLERRSPGSLLRFLRDGSPGVGFWTRLRMRLRV